VNNVAGGLEFAEKHRLPRDPAPSFTLGGTGGGIAYNREELLEILERGLDLSPGSRSAHRRERARLERVRAGGDARPRRQRIIVCSIENFDPMGVHTGDSITVAPAQTLTDREYQMMRDAALACLREIGVDTGGSNVQFAINPKTAAWSSSR
jgi:carbamoyl-phosphate synthase large subunit